MRGIDVKLSGGFSRNGSREAGSVVTFPFVMEESCRTNRRGRAGGRSCAFDLEALRYAHFFKRRQTLIVNDYRIDRCQS